jgi:hypothetical protein
LQRHAGSVLLRSSLELTGGGLPFYANMKALTMKYLRILGLIVALGALVTACNKSAGDNDAIRTAINSHLASRSNLNMSAFDTEVQKINVQGDQATADVAFKVKGGPGAMQLTYNLKKAGGNWAVVESNPIGSNFTHPDPGAAPGASSGAPSGDLMDSLRQKMSTPAK